MESKVTGGESLTVKPRPLLKRSPALGTRKGKTSGLFQALQRRNGAPLPEWDLGPEYEVERSLGSRVYGEAVLASRKQTGSKVVVERVALDGDEKERATARGCRSTLLKEVRLMRELKGDRVLELVEIRKEVEAGKKETNGGKSGYFVVSEFAGSDLKKILKSNSDIDMLKVKSLTHSLLMALKHLQSFSIIHGNLKPQNIVVDEQSYQVKLTDFS